MFRKRDLITVSLAQKNLTQFWLSRLKVQDPIARIGYALWCKSVDDLKREIRQGNSAYWDHKGFLYWEGMARSTVVNLAAGLEKSGFHGTFTEMRAKIKEVGFEVARQHAIFVEIDRKQKIGSVAGLLSLSQVAKYHHIAFAKFGIPSNFYGGTWLLIIPDSLELEAYGHLYCHDCDPA